MRKKRNPILVIGTIAAGTVGVIALSRAIKSHGSNAAGGGYGGNNAAGIPRGIANNNPLNLALSDIAWNGKVPNAQNTDFGKPRLEQFYELPFGIRANLKNINATVVKYPGIKLGDFISVWGTGSRGNYGKNAAVTNYANYVVDRLNAQGVPATVNTTMPTLAAMPDPGIWWPLFRAMAEFENDPKNAAKIAAMGSAFQQAWNMI